MESKSTIAGFLISFFFILFIAISFIRMSVKKDEKYNAMVRMYQDSLSIERSYIKYIDEQNNYHYNKWQQCEENSEHMNDALAELLGHTDSNSYFNR